MKLYYDLTGGNRSGGANRT